MCEACPDLTDTSELGSSEIGRCSCTAGSYRRDGRPGARCFPCPKGGVCDGGSHAPYADFGWWGNWSKVDTARADSVEAAEEISAVTFLACELSQDCQGGCGIEEQAFPFASERQAFVRTCRSNATNICSARTTGALCSDCDVGYFSMGGVCFKCKEPVGLFVYGSLFGIIISW